MFINILPQQIMQRQRLSDRLIILERERQYFYIWNYQILHQIICIQLRSQFIKSNIQQKEQNQFSDSKLTLPPLKYLSFLVVNCRTVNNYNNFPEQDHLSPKCSHDIFHPASNDNILHLYVSCNIYNALFQILIKKPCFQLIDIQILQAQSIPANLISNKVAYQKKEVVLPLLSSISIHIFQNCILNRIINRFYMKKSLKTQNQEPANKEPTKTLRVISDRYQIKNIHLGEGTYGQVFACWDKTTRTVLAAKTISKIKLIDRINHSKSSDKTKQFYIKSIQNEAYLMKKLYHQNILKFYGLSETVDHIYFYVQYCNQGSLAQQIEKQGKIPYDKALPIMKQILQGCLYLHERKICHRDIKPQNILMHNGTAKLSDFGFATCLQDADTITSEFSVGSGQYMAPQILFKRKTTLKCDIWSLGVTFYNMLCGCLPWEYIDDDAQWQRQLHKPITFPLNVVIPSWTTSMIQKMLTYEFQARPSIRDIISFFKF